MVAADALAERRRFKRVAFFTHDLVPGRERLMPWRTVLEVAREARGQGLDAVVFSTSVQPSVDCAEWCGVPIENVPKPAGDGVVALHGRLASLEPDCVFWPLTWRVKGRTLSFLRRIQTPVVGYLPGARYRSLNVLRAAKEVGWRVASPHLIESLVPGRWAMRRIQRAGIRGLIAATEGSRLALINAGWNAGNVVMIMPGLDDFASTAPCTSAWDSIATRLGGRPFFLFLGSPAPIRGGPFLLRAFDRLASQDPEVCLVSLMRADPGSEPSAFNKTLGAIHHKDRVFVIWDSLTRGELLPFMLRCRAAVLPFLLIPSEPPLLFLELLSLAVPLVTTETGGTSQFLHEAALVVEPGDLDALAAAMSALLHSDSGRHQLRQAARRLIQNHAGWDSVAGRWLAAAEKFCQ